MGLRKAARAAVALAALAAAAWTAAAQESGTYRSVSSYHHGYVTIQHEGETFVGGPLTGTMTITESSGGPFEVGANIVSECLVYSRNSADGLSIEAPCVFGDAAGDMLQTYATRSQGTLAAVGGGGEGTWKLLGGTGRYAGITGSCAYQTEYLAGDRLVVHSDCSWSRS